MTTPRQRRHPCTLALAATACLACAPASAEDLFWSNASGGGFLTPENWSPMQPPAPEDNAFFDLAGAYTVTLAADADVTRLVVDGATPAFALAGATLRATSLDEQIGSLVVGETDGPAATLTLESGEIDGAFVRLGRDPGADGTLDLQSGAQLTASIDAKVGAEGVGALTATSGASITGGLLVVGDAETGDGVVTLDGGALSVGGTRIGLAGAGRLEVLAGAVAEPGALIAGFESTGSGDVVVSGAGSRLDAGSSAVTIGRSGGGSLTVGAGAELAAGALAFAQTNGSATSELSGAASIAGAMTVGAGGVADVDLFGGALVNVSSLFVGTGLQGDGLLTIEPGAALVSTGPVQIGPATAGRGEIAMRGGLVSGATLDVLDNGVLNGFGSVVADVDSQGLIRPTGTLTISGDLDLDAGLFGGRLRHVVGPGFQTGGIVVTGAATLGGRLEVVLADGFTPAGEAEVELLSATAVTGEFEQIVLPGDGWSVEVEADRVLARFAGSDPADLDGNGSVGAFDLAILLNAWGPCDGCSADLDGDGDVGPFDLATLLNAWG